MGLDPFKYFAVAFAGRQFLEQGTGFKTKKLHQALVGCGIVYGTRHFSSAIVCPC